MSYLDTEGRLDAHVDLFSAYPPVIDALCSVGLLIREDGVLTFAHQSYFDHLVAERILAKAIREGRDPHDWIKANQSLFRRDQLRQLLALLRECDHTRHEALLRAILLGEGIRFHLKHLVFGLLRQVDPVLEHEAGLVLGLYRDADWRDHVLSKVIWARPPWFDALDRNGALAEWLADREGDRRVRDVLRFFRSVAEPCGERIDELLAPHWEAEGRWADLLLEVFSFNPCDDSPRMFDLRVRMVQSGKLAFNDLFIEELAKQSPERLVKLIGAAISLWVRQVRDCVRSPDAKDGPIWPCRNRRLEPSVLSAVRDMAQVTQVARFSGLISVKPIEMAHSSEESIVYTRHFGGGSTSSEDEPVITIGGIPGILEPFLAVLRPWFSKPQFRHFGPLLVAYAVVFGRRNVDSLYATMQETTCRQKLNDFMVESRWAGDEVLREGAAFALGMMNPKKGERLEILIDGSGKRKRGQATDAVGYIKEAGAMWAMAVWLDAGGCSNLVDTCRAGSKAQRLGVANAATSYSGSGVDVESTRDIVAAMFDDVEVDVRARAAGVFRKTDVLAANETARLAADFVQSSAFHDDPRELLIPLCEYTGDIVHYAQAIFGASDVLAGPLAAETRDMRRRIALAGDELSTLLLRLYEHTYGTGNRVSTGSMP